MYTTLCYYYYPIDKYGDCQILYGLLGATFWGTSFVITPCRYIWYYNSLPSVVNVYIVPCIIILVPISGTLSVKEISIFKIQSWSNGYFQLIEGVLYHFGSEVY